MGIIDIDNKASKNRWIAHTFLILFFQAPFFGSIALSLFAIITLNYKLIAILVFISILQSFTKKSQLVINLTNKYIMPIDYFKTFKRIQEEQIPENQPSIFCFHPHSVLSYCVIANMNIVNTKIPPYTGLASRFLLALPFSGFQLRLWGVQSVNPTNITRLMKNRKQIGLVPGGFEEAALTTPRELRVFIKNRKGFLKYALKHDYTIYPILVYNEHKAYKTFDGCKKLRLWLNKLKIPSVIFGFGFLWIFLPLNVDLITIFGKGIRRNPENLQKPVTDQQLNKVHVQYMNELQRIHNKYRDEYGEAPLVFQ